MSETLSARWHRIVAEHAHDPALITAGETLTFEELSGRVDHVADLLRRRRAPALAVRGTDHADAVVGTLGALLVGVPFVLVDHQLSDVARDHVNRLVGDATWLDELGAAAHTRADRSLYDEPREPHVPDEAADAYVLFTSGSTGLPKGARIGRDNLASLVDALGTRLGLGPSDVWLQVASLGFDVVIEEVLPLLFHGGTVAIRPDPYDVDPATLQADLDRSGATIVELSTRYWYEYKRWLDLTDMEPPDRLRLVIVGGERMDPIPYRDWQQRGRTPLVHVYGLTECTVTSTMYSGDLAADALDVPVGTVLDHTRLVLDTAGAPADAPAGAGEIVLGGPATGRGYVGGDLEQSARFTVAPDGSALYRTGDLGHLDAEGNLVFLGRLDEQVKIRGRRVELAELDHLYAAVPGVEIAAAVREPGPEGRVIACVRMTGGVEGSLIALFAAHVPPWAVPAAVRRVERIPVTPHGKTDRAELLASSESEPAGPAGPGAATNTARLVLACMRQVLDSPALGPDDAFLDHGGDSLSAIELVTLLRQGLGPEVSVRPRVVLLHETAHRIAQHLDASSPGADHHTRPVFAPPPTHQENP